MAQTARLRSFGVLEARVQEEDGEKVGVGKKGREGKGGKKWGRKMAVSYFLCNRVTSVLKLTVAE